MSDYLDICLRPDPEFTTPLLMSALFSKLHRALAQNNQTQIGVSFPEHDPNKPSLGDCLRLHSDEAVLEKFMALNWLNGMQDHIKLGSIQSVPANIGYRIVRRVQAKSSAERLRRRSQIHKGLGEIEALKQIPNTKEERLQLPYVSIHSQSTGQRFRLFIEHGALQTAPSPGYFNAYGLSQQASIPWF
jgi:CRISPR-associated endonuclease Csy4